MSFSIKCPYCNQLATITDSDKDSIGGYFDVKTFEGIKYIHAFMVVCPNEECKKYTLEVYFSNALEKPNGQYGYKLDYENANKWSLIPASNAKIFPDYIPSVLIQDYNEACLIVNLSPKASATLSRRCLQGIIRDFHNIKKGRLIDEINALEEVINSDLWEAIKTVKDYGNIGAHMEKDINVIVDVDAEEAEKLIGLIELLFEEWYINREERKNRIKSLVDMGKEKKEEIKKARELKE